MPGENAIPFLIMVDDKKNSYYNKWQVDHGNDAQTHSNGVIHPVIVHENDGTEPEADDCEDDTTNEFPFPCNNQKDQ